jgi:DNA-binding NarL/FixJ family response regulator
MATKRSVLVVDDHPIVREGLRRLIDRQSDLKVCGEAEEGATAMRLIREHRPDLLLLDLSLKDDSGMTLLQGLRVNDPELRVLVLSMHEEVIYAHRVIQAGARGFIMKQEAPERLITAIRSVLDGEIYLSRAMWLRLPAGLGRRSDRRDVSPLRMLSDREIEVFRLLGQGRSLSDIAGILRVSPKTAEAYRTRVKEKLGAPNVETLRLMAHSWATDPPKASESASTNGSQANSDAPDDRPPPPPPADFTPPASDSEESPERS